MAPTLFHVLDDRALAGEIAGRLFTLEAWAGVACGFLIVLIRVLRHGSRGITLLPVGMLALVLVGELVIGPRIAGLKDAGAVDSTSFAVLHGIAAAVYLVVCLLALGLVAFGGERARAMES